MEMKSKIFYAIERSINLCLNDILESNRSLANVFPACIKDWSDAFWYELLNSAAFAEFIK